MSHDAASSAARAAKSQIRSLVRTRLREMPGDERRRADRLICERLLALADETGASWAVAYLALPDEVRIDDFVVAMVERGRQVLLPRVRRNILHLGAWRPLTGLSRDDEGVLAPEDAPLQEWPPGEGMVVTPGRAFDARGGRVGRGRGYYDRLLSREGRRIAVGAAYECQVFESLPHEAHDRDVDGLVTEAACRRFRGPSGGDGEGRD